MNASIRLGREMLKVVPLRITVNLQKIQKPQKHTKKVNFVSCLTTSIEEYRTRRENELELLQIHYDI